MYKIEREDFFEKIDSEEKAYWLGFLYADGYILNGRKYKNESDAVGLSLQLKDIDHVYRFKSALGCDHPVNVYNNCGSYFSKQGYGRIIVYSNKLVHDLIGKGCLRNKTFTLQFPTEEQVPKHLLKHFIRGFLDGDGSISHNKKTFKYGISFTSTKEMLEGIKHFFNKDNLKLGKRFPERDNNNFDLKIYGNLQVMRFLTTLYKNATIYLPRKKEEYDELVQKYSES